MKNKNIPLIEEPKQTVQEYEQQGLEKHSHELKSKQECVHDIVTKFGVAECQNCGMEESEILSINKQETLKEAASKVLYNKYPFHPPQDSGYWKDMFKEGVKSDVAKNYWFKIFQSEQANKYSEEEVIAIVEKSRETGLTAEYLLLTEQFKK